MKVIVAGSREITDYDLVKAAILDSNLAVTELVSGTAGGVDTLGEKYAQGAGISIKRMPADWNKHGRGAGRIRNCEMGRYADAAIIVWDGESAGTKHMMEFMKKLGKYVYLHNLRAPFNPHEFNKQMLLAESVFHKGK